MGEDRPRPGAEVGFRALSEAGRPLKPPPDRLYGRQRGHRLRPRQQRLLDATLPRLRFPIDGIPDPGRSFAVHSNALWLEVGFGGGEHALAQVRAHPDANLIACEVFEPGLCSLLSDVVAEGEEATGSLPGNLRLWDEDARDLLRALPDGCLDRLFLLFPDPWPKARHAKRRFVHPGQLPDVARATRPGAEWRIASDDPTYQGWVHDVLAAQSFFDGDAPVRDRPDDWPPTRYEAKALRAGRTPLYWSLRRR